MARSRRMRATEFWHAYSASPSHRVTSQPSPARTGAAWRGFWWPAFRCGLAAILRGHHESGLPESPSDRGRNPLLLCERSPEGENQVEPTIGDGVPGRCVRPRRRRQARPPRRSAHGSRSDGRLLADVAGASVERHQLESRGRTATSVCFYRPSHSGQAAAAPGRAARSNVVLVLSDDHI